MIYFYPLIQVVTPCLSTSATATSVIKNHRRGLLGGKSEGLGWFSSFHWPRRRWNENSLLLGWIGKEWESSANNNKWFPKNKIKKAESSGKNWILGEKKQKSLRGSSSATIILLPRQNCLPTASSAVKKLMEQFPRWKFSSSPRCLDRVFYISDYCWLFS